MDIQTVLAAVLGVGFGLLCVVYPTAVGHAYTAGRVPPDRHGDYGTSTVPRRWQHLIRLLGVGCTGTGLYFATTLL